MTRNELIKVVKTMLISMACALPIVIAISFLLSDKLSHIATVFINTAILVIAGVVGYFIGEARNKHIQKKRAEYLKNQKDINGEVE